MQGCCTNSFLFSSQLTASNAFSQNAETSYTRAMFAERIDLYGHQCLVPTLATSSDTNAHSIIKCHLYSTHIPLVHVVFCIWKHIRSYTNVNVKNKVFWLLASNSTRSAVPSRLAQPSHYARQVPNWPGQWRSNWCCVQNPRACFYSTLVKILITKWIPCLTQKKIHTNRHTHTSTQHHSCLSQAHHAGDGGQTRLSFTFKESVFAPKPKNFPLQLFF